MDSLPAGAISSGGVIGLLLVLLASMVYGLWKALSNGTLCTGRELREKNDRIGALEKMVDVRDAQLSLVLKETLPPVASLMGALHRAGGLEETGS